MLSFSRFSCRVIHTGVFTAQQLTATVNDDGKKLKLLWEGEQERRYHGVWLRHNCNCTQCHSPYTEQTIIPARHFPPDIKITSALIQGDNLNITWSSDGGSCSHSGSLPISFLKENDYSNPKLREKRRRDAEPLVSNSLSSFDYCEVMETDEGLYKWLKHINFYGVALLKNVPTANEQELAKLADRAGGLRETIEGKTFDVVAEEKPTNEADTTNELMMHMDLGFHDSPPGLQLLHCLKFDQCVTGGESVVLDAYPVVLEIKKKHPKLFDILTRVPFPFVRVDYKNRKVPVDYLMERPIITLDGHGEVTSIQWSVQLAGPVIMQEDDVDDFYDAFRLLNKMFEESELKLYHRLRPGELLSFNNRRIVHSRKAFVTNGGQRHLKNTYVHMDGFRSKFLTLSRLLGKTEKTKHLLNGSWTA